MSEKQTWWARPYEGKWRLTDVQPTEELRRYLEFRPYPGAEKAAERLREALASPVERSPRHYDSQGYCDNPSRGY